MTNYEKIRMIRGLAKSTTGGVGGANFESISRIIADSKAKVVNLLNRNNNIIKPVVVFDSISNSIYYSTSDNTALVKKTKPTETNKPDKTTNLPGDYFSSMLNLTNYMLYENGKLIFDLDTTDKSTVEYLASEVDAIQQELFDISETLVRMRTSYKNYYENLLNLCDRKDELYELFLDYYEEYYMNDESRQQKKLRLSQTKSRKMSQIDKKKNGSTSDTTKSSRVSDTEEKEYDSTGESESLLGDMMPVDRRDVMRKIKRKSSMYLYSIPTENRFSILTSRK